jgi:hypothetical protein
VRAKLMCERSEFRVTSRNFEASLCLSRPREISKIEVPTLPFARRPQIGHGPKFVLRSRFNLDELSQVLRGRPVLEDQNNVIVSFTMHPE